MSAWYIYSTLGFYPVNPANREFITGMPQVKKAVVNLANKKQLSITNEYVNGEMIAEAGGKQLPSYILTFNHLKDGGILDFKAK